MELTLLILVLAAAGGALLVLCQIAAIKADSEHMIATYANLLEDHRRRKDEEESAPIGLPAAPDDT